MQRFTLVALLFIAACSPATDNATQVAGGSKPEVAATDWTKGAMATAANPHAVAAAIEILEQGGHAVEATIAAGLVLNLVEPQSSGIGGGAFMLVYDNDGRNLSVFDGRETAPAGATADMFMEDGEQLGYIDAWQSGLSVGVPGVIAMYKLAYDEHGTLPWADLFQPAIRLATEGFEVSPRLANYLPMMAQRSRLDENPATAAYFYPGGQPLQAGHLLKNPEYAATLTSIAEEGPDAFYKGALPEQIAAAAQAEPYGGTLTAADIGNYKAIRRDAVCGDFRDMAICSVPPPSSGVAQILIAGLYDQLSAGATSQSEKVQAFVDAQRLGYADRDHFIGDPAFVDVPTEALMNPEYIRHRATERIAPGAVPTPGDPAAVLGDAAATNWGGDTTEEMAGTSHVSIVDQDGNAVSMTITVEGAFGSGRWAGGFLLNNELTDFARTPSAEGKPLANEVAPGKRPRSSMTPTFVFDKNNDLLMVTGSPGGNSIVGYVSKTTIGVLDWQLSAQETADFPNIIARGESVRVEVANDLGKQLAANLTDEGYKVQEREGENSGIHLIIVRPDGLEGAADSRREGVVMTLDAN